MTFASITPNSKTAEFARLFDLFDRVATRRSRSLTGNTSEVISEDDIANIPAEFAPVLRNLSTILALRARRAQLAHMTQPCHNTLSTSAPSRTRATKNSATGVDVMQPPGALEQDIESPTFPLGERYPFTFKLMLHKLYDLDEWAEKVKTAVETSKSQFKPLAERARNVVRDTTKRCTPASLDDLAKFKPPNTRHPHLVALPRDTAAGRKERAERGNIIRPVLGASAKFRPPSTTRYPHTAAIPGSKLEVSRVVKKRCIGRRKSINGPMSTGVWVYDAAISATEVAGARPAVEITLSTPRQAGGLVETRARHRSLTALEDLQTRDSTRRKVKITIPLLQEEGAKSIVPPHSSSAPFAEPVQEAVQTESVVKKKRSVAFVFATEPCKRGAVKRPLCV